eukprot:scaffold136597_cov31-Tisochrysis_lutea.AAC.7
MHGANVSAPVVVQGLQCSQSHRLPPCRPLRMDHQARSGVAMSEQRQARQLLIEQSTFAHRRSRSGD